MWKEFKEFAMKGNIMDLAIGVVIGGAFQKIVNSLVSDIIMPTVSIITGKIDFTDMMITVGNASIKYGNFITAIVDFLIMAFSIFIFVKYINKLNKIKELGNDFASKIDKKGKFRKNKKDIAEKSVEEVNTEVHEPTIKICPYCLSEINYKATKCAHCTSDLSENSEENV